MTIDDDIAFLERIAIFQRLGTQALRILAIGAEAYRVEPGQVLFTAGETADGAYIVQRGALTLTPAVRGAPEAIAGPGALLGESALLAETTRQATAVAREDSTVLRVSRAMFLKMLEGYPDAAERVREVIAARVDQWAREMENVRTTLVTGNKPE